MITYDYNQAPISPDERQDLEVIAGVRIEDITIEDYPNLLVFPDSFDSYDRDLARKEVCAISADGSKLVTNSIVGFIGRNKTHLSIHSRKVGEQTSSCTTCFRESLGLIYLIYLMR